MEYRSLLVAVGLAAVAVTGVAASPDYGDGNATVRLVASADRLDASGPVLLGVEFDIKPGWHIYWKNPGGAGLATDIRWRLPAGVEADNLGWPLPVAFIQSGDIPGYGYEDSVVLAARIRSESSLPPGAVVGASVSWLACKDVCVLGSAEIDETVEEIRADLDRADWQEMLPRPVDDPELPFEVTVRNDPAGGKIGVWLRWRVAPATVEWFPAPPDGLEVDGVRIQTRGGLTRIDAVVRELGGSGAGSGVLDSLVVVTDENNRRRGWQLVVDLKQ